MCLNKNNNNDATMELFITEYILYCTTMGNNVMIDPTPAATTAVGNATPVVAMSLTHCFHTAWTHGLCFGIFYTDRAIDIIFPSQLLNVLERWGIFSWSFKYLLTHEYLLMSPDISVTQFELSFNPP